MSAKIAVIGAFIGCCLNLVFLELHVKEDPGCGNLVTFSQFLFISVEGFIFTSKLGTVKPVVPMTEYIAVMLLFFLCNVCNNYAFNLNIPMPLHMVFRAGSLITNMVMCVIVQKRSYSLSKYVAVLLITFGVIICTVISGQEIKSKQPVSVDSVSKAHADDFFWWTIGIALLTVGLLISARMGIYQEEIHVKYGKRPAETLFYTHLLSMPFFLFLMPNIWEHFKITISSTPLVTPVLGISLPSVAVYLIGNVISQYICIRSVYQLTAECTSLTVNLVLTLRKFTSLLFSVIYFENAFTIYHWVGSVLVFIGTVMFTEVISRIRNSINQYNVKKEQ